MLSTRIGRLLRARELKKNRNDGSPIPEIDVSRNSHVNVDQYPETAAHNFIDGWERPDGKPTKQRLLVVANRLPVSAVRRGEDSWSLEISAGGLVSALLGEFFYLIQLSCGILSCVASISFCRGEGVRSKMDRLGGCECAR